MIAINTVIFIEDNINILLLISLDLFWKVSEKLSISYTFEIFEIIENSIQKIG